ALKGVSLTLNRGTFAMLRGRSGSGKTTLLNVMGGLDRPSRGRVLFKGRDIGKLSDKQATRWRRTEVGFVFQAFALVQVLTAIENVELPMRVAGVKASVRRQRARECLNMVGLGKRAGHRVYELSGGEQQRVSIARAISNRPELLLADEPTGELDEKTSIQILTLFQEIVAAEGLTICMATHDPTASEYGDITYSLVDGRIVAEE
ncbi:MAG TPA: ABC transporter ATP-binding protein, partial [Limnochordia bacterium]|nr:ABC transporter ATP-binding protein [Limnochordia bacterium]